MKLPAPREEDLSKGVLDAIDMESYRVEKQAMRKIALPDEDAEIDPVPTSEGSQRPEPAMEKLSNIIRVFNEHFGDIPWGRRRPSTSTYHRDHSLPRGGGHRLPERPAKFGQGKRAHRA